MSTTVNFEGVAARKEDTGVLSVTGLLTAAECDQIIAAARGKTTRVEGPGQEPFPTWHPDGYRPNAWHWHCVVHAHPVKNLSELHGADAKLWALVCTMNDAYGWHIPLDVRRFGISNYPAGDRMGFHVDDEARKPSTPAEPWIHPHRGISVSVSLTPPGNHDGGNLRVLSGGKWITPLAGKPRGTAVAFGASTLHEVTRVTTGERWALLAWTYANHWERRMR